MTFWPFCVQAHYFATNSTKPTSRVSKKQDPKKCIIVVILHDTHKNAHIIPLETQQKLTSFKAQLL